MQIYIVTHIDTYVHTFSSLPRGGSLVYIYICIYTHTHTYVYIYSVHIYVYMYTYIYIVYAYINSDSYGDSCTFI